jgi:hypothetical protein
MKPVGTMLCVSNGLVIADGLAAVVAKFTRFRWDWYDGVRTAPDIIEPVDFAITIAMNSRATADRMKSFMERSGRLGRLLQNIPRDVPLARETPPSVLNSVAELFDEACKASGTALAVASKVLHRKRPALIPMLDRVIVDRHYLPALRAPTHPPWFKPEWLKTGSWSDPTQYMRLMADELDDNREALERIRAQLPDTIPSIISDVRLLEAALYAQLIEIVI